MEFHGESGGKGKRPTPEYRSWVCMLSRCYAETHHRYEDYGAKGVVVCARWRHSYVNFLADMGRRPTSKHTLDRRNNRRGYSPRNCRWATAVEQNRNKYNNLVLTIDGRSQCAAAWAEQMGILANTLCERLRRGWSIRDAVLIPTRRRGGSSGKKAKRT